MLNELTFHHLCQSGFHDLQREICMCCNIPGIRPLFIKQRGVQDAVARAVKITGYIHVVILILFQLMRFDQGGSLQVELFRQVVLERRGPRSGFCVIFNLGRNTFDIGQRLVHGQWPIDIS